MPLFLKNVMQFRLFTTEMDCENVKKDFSNKVIILTATSVLIFQYKYARKTSFKRYYTIGQRQIC